MDRQVLEPLGRTYLVECTLVLTQYSTAPQDQAGFMPYLILQIYFTTPGYTHGGTQGDLQPSVSCPVHLAANCELLDNGFSAGRNRILSTLSTAPSRLHRCMLQHPPNPKLLLVT